MFLLFSLPFNQTPCKCLGFESDLGRFLKGHFSSTMSHGLCVPREYFGKDNDSSHVSWL